MSKIVFQTDRAGHLVSLVEADESPMEPGVYLMPAGAVETPPPAEWPDKKWPRWDGKKWKLITIPTVATADPVDKLKQFLIDNPDVLAVLNPSQGGV